MEQEPIRVGLMGLGTVGSGVVRLVKNHQEDLWQQTGRGISIERILVRDKGKERSVQVDSGLLTERPEEILQDKGIDLVVEVMGGIEPAYTCIREALEEGKHVVTANKDLMALHGAELLSIAGDKGCDLFYEASVAGGIPVLRALTEGLSADRISTIMGIVNGTTNYILTEMARKGTPFADALAKAQDQGYAESDPTADVEGLDAARKMAILAYLGFHTHLALDEIPVQGIRDVTTEDIQFADQLGYVLKLIGIAKRNEGKMEVSVQPALLSGEHPLASVDGVFKAVYIHGEAVGETMFYGPGAGEMPTATAVVSDLVTVVKHMELGVNGRGMVAPYCEKRWKSPREIFSKHFLRLRLADEAGVMAGLTSVFAEAAVSLEKVLQVPISQGGEAEIVLITHTASQHQLETILRRLDEMPAVRQLMSHYRVEGGNG